MIHPVKKSTHRMLQGTVILLCCMLLLIGVSPAMAADEKNTSAGLDSLLPLVGGALVEAGAGGWEKASAELTEFENLWNKLEPAPSGETAEEIANTLKAAKEAVGAKDAEEAKEQLSSLAKQVNTFTEQSSEQSEASASGKDAAGQLLKMVNETLTPLNAGKLEEAKSRYKEILNQWGEMEGPIRGGHFGVYSDIETHMSLIRIALQAEPAKQKQAIDELNKLITLLQNYTEGKLDDASSGSAANEGKASLKDALALLREADEAAEEQNASQAADQMQAFIVMWPTVEGEVSVTSSSIYTATENRMSEAQSYLLSSPPDLAKARLIIGQMLSDLAPLANKQTYTAWDAALVLLREGLEAILVVAALLAFAKRAQQKSAQRYIWTGAGSGLLLSIVLAVLLTYTVSQAVSGGARELFEGIIGLLAVVMMLAVGHFLHSRSSIQAWNHYVAKQVGGALERGSMWSLFILSGLAILREGAETAVFYIGMAPSMEPMQLITGMLGAILALTVLGFLMIRFSVKLPIRPFMLTATVFIYYLVIRFLGESIHALQVAGALPAHTEGWLPTAGWIGAYPTWETFLPQCLLLLFVIWRLMATERRKTKPLATENM
ncbi:FTR1 family protein [Paenibacillus puldeungensis]|uniref:FTR1 family protein n=1 Tax=Paenibacillus puldeungensis TaxID=696536 RepID=A0ABW3S2P0_9BACL